MLGILRCGTFAVALSWVFVGFAGAAVWTGGSGDWSDAANWRDGAKPVLGDTVHVSNAVGNVTINIDDADVSIASIRFEGASPVALTGNGLTLTGGFSTTAASNILDFPKCVAGFLSYDVAVDCDVPLAFEPASGNCGICTSGITTEFRRKVTSTGTASFRIHTGSRGNVLGTANFRAEVEAPNATLRPQQHPTGYAHFYGPVTFKDIEDYGWSGEALSFHAPGNSWGKLTLDYGNCTMACVAGSYPSNMVVALGNTHEGNNKDGSFNLGNYDTVIDRLDGDLLNGGKLIYVDTKVDSGHVRSTSEIKGGGTALPAVLTMNATADGLSSFKICDQVSLVWNPAEYRTLTMTGRVHTTTGSIEVRKGGFRMAGACSFATVSAIRLAAETRFDQASTLVGALAGVKTIDLGADARLSFPAGTAQECKAAVVNLAPGAKIELSEGTALEVAAVNVGGAFLGNGTYSGTDWIDGAGQVKVDSGKIAYWKNPAGGDWSVGANWTSGVAPTGANGLKASLTMKTTSSYTVTLDTPLEMYREDLDVSNEGGGLVTLLLAADVTVTQANISVSRGGLIDVPEGRTFTFFGTPDADSYPESVRRTIAIENGGEWRTSGGTTVITNFCGSFLVTGDGADATGKLTMSSGVFQYMNKNSGYPLSVAPGGRLDFTGGTFLLPHQGYNNKTDLKNLGGTIRIRDAVLNTAGTFAKPNGGSIAFGSGETFFEGGAELRLAGGVKVVMPSGAGETAALTFRDGAKLISSGDHIPWGLCGKTGKAIVNWNSGDSGSSAYFQVGVNSGCGELNVISGTLKGHSLGMKIGGYSANVLDAVDRVDEEASGQVTVMDGAALEIEGSLHEGWSAASDFSALVVGYGISSIDRRFAYRGRLDLYGTLLNKGGNAVIGLGKAEGTYVQHQGSSTFQTKNENGLFGQTIVGMAGGRGQLIVSNGTFEVRFGNFYVGGCSTDDLQPYSKNAPYERIPWVAPANYPADWRDADGKVAVVNGAMTVGNATILGADGKGALEMVGSSGSFTTRDLVLSNSTESVLRFVPDAGGVSPIRVTGSLAVCDDAKIALDLTGYPEGRRMSFKVLDTTGATVEGKFSLEHVSVAGVDPGESIGLRQTDSGVTVSIRRGMVLLLR